MLQNAYLLAKIGADTAENERNFAENLPKIGKCPTGRGLAQRFPRQAAARMQRYATAQPPIKRSEFDQEIAYRISTEPNLHNRDRFLDIRTLFKENFLKNYRARLLGSDTPKSRMRGEEEFSGLECPKRRILPSCARIARGRSSADPSRKIAKDYAAAELSSRGAVRLASAR